MKLFVCICTHIGSSLHGEMADLIDSPDDWTWHRDICTGAPGSDPKRRGNLPKTKIF